MEKWRESAERRAPRHQHDKVHLEKRGERKKNMRAHAQCQTFKRGAALCGDLIGEIKTIAADGGCESSLFHVEFPPILRGRLKFSRDVDPHGYQMK